MTKNYIFHLTLFFILTVFLQKGILHYYAATSFTKKAMSRGMPNQILLFNYVTGKNYCVSLCSCTAEVKTANACST